jgi:aminoglycoside phosphotransferase family enzyme
MPADSDHPPSTLVHALQQLLAGRCGRPVQLVETHISWVLLDGEHAWKLKKPVQMGFLDFSTVEARRRACEEELRLNRRLAEAIYLRVDPVHGTPEAPALEGEGEPIDHLVVMRQFPPGSLLSERLAAGRLEPAHIDQLARRIGRFHESAPVAPPGSAWGQPETIAASALVTLDRLEAVSGESACSELRAWLHAQAVDLTPVWRARLAAGRVREGHGDLHLANTLVLGEEVTAFDCIEFDPALRWIDVMHDLAFLLMDLMAHGRPGVIRLQASPR